jgi:Tfp pilus assembly protein PilV
MTLVEVILAVVILSGTMLGLADFARRFQSNNSTSSVRSLASDLATARIEEIRAWPVYGTLVSTFDGTIETFPSTSVYTGFTRTTAAVRCTGCPTATHDYVTVTVTVTGNNLASTMKKTVYVAAF